MRISDWSSDVCSADLPMHRGVEARDFAILQHQISAPPPKLKNDRKKLDAANAIDRPNTIWISLRKPPPESPKASVRPVTMITITAMIFATGPSIASRMDWSGASQGIDEPEARTGADRVRATTQANAPAATCRSL